MNFKQWLRTQESSAFTRRRSAAARGLMPPIPDASLHSRSTCSPGELDLIKGKKKKKKRKNESKDANPDTHIDKWLQSVDSLKRDLDDLNSKKSKRDNDDLEDEDDLDDDDFDDLDDDDLDDDDLDDDDLDDDDLDDDSESKEQDYDFGQDAGSEVGARKSLRPNVVGNRPDFSLRRLPSNQI